MARFEFDAGGGQVFEADAPDLAAAKRAYDSWKGQGQAPAAPLSEWEQEVQAAQADPRNTGVERGLRQASDLMTFGLGPRVSDYMSSVTDTGQLLGEEQHQAYRRRQALTEASRRPVPSGGAAQWTGDVAARTAGGLAGVAALPLRAAQPVVETARRAGVTLTGRAGELLNNLRPATTRGQNVAEGARIGTSFGAAGGFGTSSPDATLGETLSDMGVHAAGGALIGSGIPLAAEGVGRLVGGARELARTMAGGGANARARSAAWDELGLEPPAVALLGPTGQARAGRLADTIVGGSTRGSIEAGARSVEESLREALGATGRRTASEAGAEAQQLVRQGLTARRSDEELSALGREELEALSGVGRNAAPPVTATTPEEVMARAPRRGGLSARLAGEEPAPEAPAASRPRRGLLSRLGQKPEPREAPPPPAPPAPPGPVARPYTSRADLVRGEVERTPSIPPVPPSVPDEASVMVRQAERGPLRAELPARPEQMPHTADEARALYEAQDRVRRAEVTSGPAEQHLAQEIALTQRRLQEATDRQQRNERLSQPRPLWQETEVWEGGPRIPAGPPVPGLGQERRARAVELLAEQRRRWEERLVQLKHAQRNTTAAQAQRALEDLQENIRLRQIREWTAARQANEEQFTAGLGTARTAAAYETTREAQLAAQLADARRELRRVEDAVTRANTEYEAYRLEAQADTLRRQIAANAEHAAVSAADDAAARSAGQAPPMRLPQRRESFAEQVEAGERALAASVPKTQQPLLEQPGSALRGALDKVGLTARGANQLPGYKSEELFSAETGRLNEDLYQYLRGRVGPEVADALNAMALQFQRGRFAQGVAGTEQILTMLINARTRRGPDGARILSELHAAVEKDLDQMLSKTPEGLAWVQAKQRLRAVRARIIEELEAPLRAVMGTETSPAAALSMLQNSARSGGDIRVLQAFLRVAEAKGDRSAAASLVLQGLAEGGLTGFMRNYRALSPEARQLLFAGPMAPLGARLERLMAAASTMENVAGRATRMRAMPQIRQALGAAIWGWVHLPSVFAIGLGAKSADAVLGSRGFARWLQKLPPTPAHRGWGQQMQMLRGYLTEGFGVNEALGIQAARLVKATISPGKAQAQVRPVTFGGAEAADPPPGREAVDVGSPDEAWQRSGWMRDPEGVARFEIDDSSASITEAGLQMLETGRGAMRLDQFIQHPELLRQFPGSAGLRVRAGGGLGDALGRYDPLSKTIILNMEQVTDEETAIRTVLHEWQHWERTNRGRGPTTHRAYDDRIEEDEARLVEERVGMDQAERRRTTPEFSARSYEPRLGPDTGSGVRSFGKGSVQTWGEREALGQHNLIPRAAEAVYGVAQEHARALSRPESTGEFVGNLPAGLGGVRGPPGRYPRRVLTDEDVATIVARHRRGSSLRDIAEDYDRTAPAIRTLLREAGMDTSQPGLFAQQNIREALRRGRERGGNYVSVPLERVAELRAQGMNNAQIARELGSSREIVRRALQRVDRNHGGVLRVEREAAEGAPYPAPLREAPSRTTRWRRKKAEVE